MPTATDLVTDLPADFEVFGQAVATSMADLLGGTTGQVLSKTSNTDMDFTWVAPTTGDITGVTAGTGISGGGTSGDVTVTNSMATAMTTSGDLIQATGSGTFARLGTGTAGQYLTTNGTTNSWGTITPGGMTLLSTTTLSGASVTLSSISQSYKKLYLVFRNFLPATGGSYLTMNFNSDTGTRYFAGEAFGQGAGIYTFNRAFIYLTGGANNTTTYMTGYATLYDYSNTTTWKMCDVVSFNNDNATPTSLRQNIMSEVFNQIPAITSITIQASAGNLTSGSVLLYGVN